MPKRIQRRRTKGWRMPQNTVYVGRPTMYGNPYPAAQYGQEQAVSLFRQAMTGTLTMTQAAALLGRWDTRFTKDALAALRGYDLACWCPLGQPCHADVLLEVANA